MAEDLGKQVELQAQLNKLLQDRIKLQNKLNEACGKQCAAGAEMNAAAEQATANQQKQVAGQEKITQAQEASRKSQDKNAKSADGFFSKISTGQAAAAGGMVGLVQGFKDFGASMGGLGGMIKSFTSGLFSIGAAILKLPFDILGGLIGMANRGAGAGIALRQAYEDVRKEFGSFTEGPAKNIVAGFKDMRSSAGNLAGTGLSLSKVYGYGPDGMAAAMKDVAEIAKGLGPAMNLLGDEFKEVAAKAAMVKKGLGLTGEQMGKLMKDAKLSGKSQTDMMTEVGSMSLQMADRFNLSSKDIARDIADMKGDFVSFGNITTTQMGAVSAYARKLGMDMKDLKGVVDKFDDFESAADSVSQLNQAFGMQLDTMKMMNAENPAERIDMLRNSFHAAGKSVETMTRQEKKLLMAQTGLTEAALKNAFAAENQGVAYADFADAAAESEEAQMSEKEVMLKLAKAIEKVVQTGPAFTGIFDAFFKGFGKGLYYQKDFNSLMKTIRQFLREVYNFGKMIGNIFGTVLNDLGIIGDLKKIFDPGKFAAFAKTIKTDIKSLVNFLFTGKGDPNVILQGFADKFAKFFGDKKGAVKGLGKAFKKLGEMMLKLFVMLTSWVWKKISPLVMDMFEKVKKYASENWKPIAMGFAKYVIAPMFILAFIKGLAFAMAGGLVKMVAAGMLKVLVATKAASAAGASGMKAAPASKGIAAFLKSIGAIPGPVIVRAGFVLLMLAGVFSVGVVMFAAAVAVSAMMLSKVSWGGIIKTIAVVTLAIYATSQLIIAANVLAQMKGQIPNALLGLIGAGLVFAVGMVAYALGIAATMAILKGIPLLRLIAVMAIIGGLMIATAVMMVGAALLVADGGATMGLALLGLLGAGTLFVVGMVAYAAGLLAVSKIMAGIPLMKLIGQLAVIGLAMTATVGLLLLAAPLGVPTSLAAIALAVVGAVAAAALFTGGMLVYGAAIWTLSKALPDEAIKAFPEVMKTIGLAMLATVGLLGMAALGILAGIGYPLIIAGLLGAAALFTGGMLTFAGAVATVDAAFTVPKDFEKKLEIIAQVVGTTATMLKMSGKFGLATLLGFGGPSIDAAAEFFIKSGPTILNMVQSIDKIKVPNPKKTAAVVGIVKDIISAMAKLSELAPQQGMFGTVATLLSGGSPSAMIDSMGSFISDIMFQLEQTVANLVELSQKFSAQELKNVGPIATIIGAIAKLAGALAPTLKMISDDASYASTMKYLSGGTIAPNTNAVLDGMVGVFDVLNKKLPPFITGLVNVMTKAMKGKDPKKVAEQAKALDAIMGAIVKVMSSIEKFQGMVEKQDGVTTSTQTAMKEVEQMFDTISNMVQPGGAISKAIEGMVTLGKELAKADKIDISAIQTQLDKIALVADKVLPSINKAMQKISTMEFVNIDEQGGMFSGRSGKSLKDVLVTAVKQMAELIKEAGAHLTGISDVGAPFGVLATAMTNMISIVNGFKAEYFGPDGQVAAAVGGIVEAYETTVTALMQISNNPIDMSVKLQTFADAMGISGDTFTVQNEALNFTVNMTVQLDANKLVDVLTDNVQMRERTLQLA